MGQQRLAVKENSLDEELSSPSSMQVLGTHGVKGVKRHFAPCSALNFHVQKLFIYMDFSMIFIYFGCTGSLLLHWALLCSWRLCVFPVAVVSLAAEHRL